MADAPPRVLRLRPRPLTPEAFAEFGTVVGPERMVLTSTEFPFFTNVASLQPADRPITYLNRHHDHHQIFASLGGQPMIVVVASPRLSAAEIRPEDVQAFVTDGQTAIVFHVETWHLEPRAAGRAPIRALNVQATNNHVHTERVELAPTFGWVIQLEVPRVDLLLARIDQTWARLEDLVGRLGDPPLLAPGANGWTIKDHLAHLATWEQVLLARLAGRDRAAALGLDAASADLHVDAINRLIYERNQGRSLADVLASSRETHQQVRAAIARLDDADLLRPSAVVPGQPGADGVRPIIGWLTGMTWKHYEEHLAAIEADLESARTDGSGGGAT